MEKVKYRGKQYILTENKFNFVPGFIYNYKGLNIVSVSRNLPKWKRQLELHRLITGRGLRDIRTGKPLRIA